MIGTSISISFNPSGGAYNSYITAYLSRISALGYTAPDSTRLNALNTLTTSLNSVLTKCDIFYIFTLNNPLLEEAATLNLVNPSAHQAVPSLSPTYGTNGFMGDGATSYIDTNYNPQVSGVNYQLDSASRFFYIETIPSTGTILEGTLTTSARNHSTYNAATTVIRINSGANNLSATVDTTGVDYKGINRQSSTNVSIYNGLTKSDRTQTSVVRVNENQTIGKGGTAFSDAEFGMYGMGASLTESEHNLIRSSYLTYRTAIGL